ncbi:guanine nucleotide-binding protein subunit beta-like protein 1 isoform X3 [Petaurus breviceps papuanus]
MVDLSSRHGSSPSSTTVRTPRFTVSSQYPAFLLQKRGPKPPTAVLWVTQWTDTCLEPADSKTSCHPGWPCRPVCVLGEDSGRSTLAPQVQVLDMPSKTSVCTLKPEAGAKAGMPMCLELWKPASGSSPLLLAGYEDGSVILWNVSERRRLSRLSCHKEPVMSLDFDSGRAKGLSGSSEKVLCIWSLDAQHNLKVCRTQELTNPGIADIAIRPDGKILATAGWDHRIRLFGWKQLKPLAVLDYHSAAVHCVAFSDPGRSSEQLLAGGSKDQRISVWSVYNQT